jgi:hypothetical protein
MLIKAAFLAVLLICFLTCGYAAVTEGNRPSHEARGFIVISQGLLTLLALAAFFGVALQ